jgi:murein tripeptide amidase MpaA
MRVVQLPIAGRSSLDSLARLGFEVADVRRIAGVLNAIIVVSPETEARLTQRGYRATPPALARVPTAVAEDTFRTFHSFDNPGNGIRATLVAWAAADTQIHVDSVGASYEGRPILAVKIGSGSDDPGRPNVLFMATHHAREWISTAVAMKLIRWLADSGGAALTTHDVWVIPVENPDGYQYTFTNERYWRIGSSRGLAETNSTRAPSGPAVKTVSSPPVRIIISGALAVFPSMVAEPRKT